MIACRLCKGRIKEFLNLGRVPLPEELRLRHDLDKPVIRYPLGLSYCLKCFHIQLSRPVDQDEIYKRNYFYDYSVTKTGFDHWNKLSGSLSKKYRLKRGDLVLDIGSNTGTLLSFFKKMGLKTLGVDPFSKAVAIARKKKIETMEDYFNLKTSQIITSKYGRAKLITCNNTFDHVEDIDEFMQSVQTVMDPLGALVIEVPYAVDMLQKHSHLPYHQQIDYMRLHPLIPFLRKYNLEITDCSHNELHGGTIRFEISFIGTKRVNKSVRLFLKNEQFIEKNPKKIFTSFAQEFVASIHSLQSYLAILKKKGKRICGVGASAKGITLLNCAEIGADMIDFISEKSPLKVGRFTPTKIPIVTDSWLMKEKPDYALLLAWNFQKEIRQNLGQYQKQGGIFIIPIPRLKLLP